MIIEHDNMPFYADVHMDGKLRGHMVRSSVSRFSGYYQDKKELSKTLVPGGFVPELCVDSSIDVAHDIWNCLAAKREVDSRIFTPSACTSVRFNEAKLRAALGGLTSGSWNEDIMKCTRDEGSEVDEDAKTVHLHLSCDLKSSLFGIKRKPIAVRELEERV